MDWMSTSFEEIWQKVNQKKVWQNTKWKTKTQFTI